MVPDANHFFQDKIEGAYVDKRTIEMEQERRE